MAFAPAQDAVNGAECGNEGHFGNRPYTVCQAKGQETAVLGTGTFLGTINGRTVASSSLIKCNRSANYCAYERTNNLSTICHVITQLL